MQEPLYIPMPGPGEFCRGRYVSVDGKRCCLLGWKNVAFFGNPRFGMRRRHRFSNAAEAFSQALARAAKRRGYACAHLLNDDPSVSEKTLAEVWAEAAAERDYELEETAA